MQHAAIIQVIKKAWSILSSLLSAAHPCMHIQQDLYLYSTEYMQAVSSQIIDALHCIDSCR